VKITEYESLRQAICQHAERASEKLRKERQYCRHISVFIKTSPFAVKELYGNVATEKLFTPTQIPVMSLPLPYRLWSVSGGMVTGMLKPELC
jgi:DNA polymerase V